MLVILAAYVIYSSIDSYTPSSGAIRLLLTSRAVVLCLSAGETTDVIYLEEMALTSQTCYLCISLKTKHSDKRFVTNMEPYIGSVYRIYYRTTADLGDDTGRSTPRSTPRVAPPSLSSPTAPPYPLSSQGRSPVNQSTNKLPIAPESVRSFVQDLLSRSVLPIASTVPLTESIEPSTTRRGVRFRGVVLEPEVPEEETEETRH
ncbi:9318_t:CDS:2 [Acaulospora colombiana]|uniref:9318_t:CDS:1 n=1 Tax=Acaulospora colombiana TaxID=27376 RepID=A0ACA9PQ74_9GLOM|nr:9318_t:CDS:2 [Acaulospora colombiana]